MEAMRRHIVAAPRAILLALVWLLALLHHTTPAAAGAQGPLYSAPQITALEVAAVPGHAPSTMHASGTLILAWTDQAPPLRKVTIAEWGVAEQRLLVSRVIRTCKATDSCTVRLARSSDLVIALTGGYSDRADVPLEVISLGLDLTEKRSRILGAGATPILDADDRFILAGAWEERPPVLPAIHTGDQVIQPRHVLSLRVLDPTTLQTLGARVFTGAHLLSPNLIVALHRAQSARLGNGGAWIALPDDELHVLHVQVPSLATNAGRVFPRIWDGVLERTQSGVTPIGSNVLVIGDHLRLLSASLATIAEEQGHNSGQLVYDSTKAQLFSEAMAPARIDTISIRQNRIAHDNATILWAFGRRAIVAHSAEGPSKNPMANWGVAVVP